MITVKLQGGLGNQMFQYALGRSISERLHTSLSLDVSFYDASKNREFELNKFNIQAHVKKATAWDKVLAKFKKENVIKDTGKFNPEIFQTHDGSVLEGYWQSEKYFGDMRDKIREELTLKVHLGEKAKIWENKIQESNAISVHVRRGDYLSEKHKKIFSLLSPEYYRKAAHMIASKTVQPIFYVFSDDRLWAEANLKLSYPSEFASGESLSIAEELALMSTCRHNIIANSSFSWWAAWLNRNPEKIVIAPQSWFVDGVRDSSDIVPKSWILM